MKRSCIRCGADLVPDPIHKHWAHCPTCEPAWVRHIRNYNRLQNLDQLATAYASDQRGRPTIGGERR